MSGGSYQYFLLRDPEGDSSPSFLMLSPLLKTVCITKKTLSNETRIQDSFALGTVFAYLEEVGSPVHTVVCLLSYLCTCEESTFLRMGNCKQLLFHPSENHFAPF